LNALCVYFILGPIPVYGRHNVFDCIQTVARAKR
jgi:hypothetical protein